MRTRLRTLLVLAVSLGLPVSPISAEVRAMWVQPGAKTSTSQLGNWATTPGDDTLSHGILPDFMPCSSARLVFIETADVGINYKLSLSLTRDGRRHDWVTDNRNQGLLQVVLDALQEIDVTDIYAAQSLVAGVDSVTLAFESSAGSPSPWSSSPRCRCWWEAWG